MIYETNSNELKHFGILGMKWGVRRYQNKDGSYTKAGLERYNKSKYEYELASYNLKKAKRDYKNAKDARKVVKTAKKVVKTAKNVFKSSRKLRNDVLADQGKELTKKGKKIVYNNAKNTAIVLTTGVAALASHKFLQHSGKSIATKYGSIPLKRIAPAIVAAGGAFVLGASEAKKRKDDERLLAYYNHPEDNE